jgi:hypothetical protein
MGVTAWPASAVLPESARILRDAARAAVGWFGYSVKVWMAHYVSGETRASGFVWIYRRLASCRPRSERSPAAERFEMRGLNRPSAR